MPDPDFYFDTYALFERLRGNPSYAPYVEMPVVTHQMNVYELVTALLREQSETRARQLVTSIDANFVDADMADLFDAADFRKEYARRRVSHIDALGYVLARRHSLKFLTGDKAFKGLENVEYVA